MGLLDAPLRSAALSLIAKFGKAITLRTPGSTYDPATGRVSGDPADVQVRALIEDYPAFLTLGGSRESGAGVIAGDKKVTIAAAAVASAPATTQQLLIDGSLYGLEKVDAIYSGDQAALYVMQARK